MTLPEFSKQSLEKLATCHPDIQLVFERVVARYDCKVLEGYRTPEQQLKNFIAGASKVKFGKHNESPSKAIDISPFPIPDFWGEKSSKEKAKFYHFAGYVLGVAHDLGIAIRWGGDWDMDGDFDDQTFDDLVHFELVG